jgi:hypothetical protein
MKSIPVIAAGVAFALAWDQRALAQDAASVIGVWKVKSIERRLENGKVEKHYGDNPGGQFICTKNGNMAIMAFAHGRPPIVLGSSTDADRANLFKTMYSGYGRCAVEGSKLVLTYERSWHEVWSGKTFKFDLKVNKDTFTITTSPVRQPDITGLAVVTTTFEHVER